MHPLRITGIVAGFLILVAAVLPWMTVSGLFGGVSTSGVSGDGKFTLIGGIAIGVLVGLWQRGTLIAATAVSGLVTLIGLVGLIRVVSGAAAFGILGQLRPGIGLILTVLFGIGALVVSAKSISVATRAAGTHGGGGAPAFGAPAFGAPTRATAYPAGVPQAPAPPPAPARAPAVAPPPAPARAPAVAMPPAPPPAAPAPPAPAPPPPPTAGTPPPPPGPPPAPSPNGPPAPAAPPAPPAGWYADPYGTAQMRHWDGATWTAETR